VVRFVDGVVASDERNPNPVMLQSQPPQPTAQEAPDVA
jgi:hypothetical protein